MFSSNQLPCAHSHTRKKLRATKGVGKRFFQTKIWWRLKEAKSSNEKEALPSKQECSQGGRKRSDWLKMGVTMASRHFNARIWLRSDITQSPYCLFKADHERRVVSNGYPHSLAWKLEVQF